MRTSYLFQRLIWKAGDVLFFVIGKKSKMYFKYCPGESSMKKIRVFAWPAVGINPYTGLLYAEIRKLGVEVADYSHRRAYTEKFDILHCHWPMFVLSDSTFIGSLLRTALLFLRFALYKIKGVKIVWTAHNFAPHDGKYPGLFNAYRHLFPKFIDGVVALSSTCAQPLREVYTFSPKTHFALAPHGDYQAAYPHIASKEDCRRQLSLDACCPVYCFYGLIRPYKNVPHLIRTFSRLTDENARLIVAGDPSPASQKKELLALAEKDSRVQLYFSYFKGEEIQNYVRPADMVVLPFRHIYNSGSAILALSMGRPALLPNLPIFQELQSMVGAGWLRLFDGELTPDQLREGMEWARDTPRGEYPDFTQMSWEAAALAHNELYKKVLNIR